MRNSLFVLVALPVFPYSAPSKWQLYVDQKASPRLTKALAGLARDLYGLPELEPIGSNLAFKIARDYHEVTIAGVLEYRVSAPEGQSSHRPHPIVENHLYQWLSNPVQWAADKVKYSSSDETHEYAGTNSLLADFSFRKE